MVTIMSRQWILLLLLLLPATLGIATFGALQYAISKDEDGVMRAPGAAPAANESGRVAPAASEQKDADLSTPPATNERSTPPANPANRPAAPIPAQNDSAEVYGPARFAASIEMLEEPFGLMPTTPRGSIRLAALSRSHAVGGGGGGGARLRLPQKEVELVSKYWRPGRSDCRAITATPLLTIA